jgi:hypothetical protein
MPPLKIYLQFLMILYTRLLYALPAHTDGVIMHPK